MKKYLLILVITLTSYYTFGQTFNPTPSINAAGSANTFVGGYTFAYATSGSPWNGAFMSFGGLTNRYDCQFSTDYGVGNHISFRTHNGDAPNIWNPWYEIYHSGNLNNSSTDFTARNITTNGLHIASGIYAAAQGAYLGWNMSHSTGEVNFVNNIGGGAGGFYFDDTSDGTTFTRLMTIQGNGNVGIGTASPAVPLHIVKSSIANTDVPMQKWDPSVSGYSLTFSNYNGVHGIDYRFTQLSNNISFPVLTIQAGGNIGIGTTTPDQKLAVNGTIHSKVVLVDLTGWSDYVFKPEYQIPSLSEVKKYIDEKGRLPEMPSEQEIVKNGLNMGEMNKLLTKKVEELTLYIIELQKNSEAQLKMIQELQQHAQKK